MGPVQAIRSSDDQHCEAWKKTLKCSLSPLDGIGASEVCVYYVDALVAPTAAGNAGSDSDSEDE